MKLVYWCAECLTDSSCYNIREKRKRDAVREANERNDEDGGARFGPVFKVEIEYDSGFDLLQECLGEGGLWQESPSIRIDIGLDLKGGN